MSINALLSTVILVSFIVTLVLAVGSYLAYKMREKRRPAPLRGDAAGGPMFFERVYPAGPARRAPDASAGD